jgi:putative flippase GtrA
VAALIAPSSALRFARFLAVGVLNTAFGYSVFAALYLLSGGMHRMAITVATVIGVAFNYFTTGRLVFANRGLAALVPFVLGYAAVLALNILAVDLLVDARFSALAAQLVCLPVVVLCSYLINDRLVFGRRT